MSSIDSKVRVFANDSTKWKGLQMRAINMSMLFLEPYLYPKDIHFELKAFSRSELLRKIELNGHISRENIVYAEITLLDHSKSFEDPSSKYYKQDKHPFPKLIGKDIEEHPYFGLIHFFAEKGVPVFVDTDYEPAPVIKGAFINCVGDVEYNIDRVELLKSSIGNEEYEKLRSDWLDKSERRYRDLTRISFEDLHRPFTILGGIK